MEVSRNLLILTKLNSRLIKFINLKSLDDIWKQQYTTLLEQVIR